MEASTANFRTLFPEFDDPVLTDDQVQFYLDLATELHRCSGTAQLYLAAHLAAQDIADGVGNEGTDPTEQTGAGGISTQEKVGDLSVTYKRPEDYATATLTSTPYGARALLIMKAARNRLTVSVHE